MQPETDFKYRAFISYSHRDEIWGRWLHRALETYRVPAGVMRHDGSVPPRRLVPIFRDHEELSATNDLSESVSSALRDSQYLIVICSPHSASSRWVNEEVRLFKAMGREQCLLCLVVDGEPNATERGDPNMECFAPALRYAIDSNGELTSVRREPLAADARAPNGKSSALLKLASALLQVDLGQLTQRELRRKRNRAIAIGLAVLGILSAAYLQQYLNAARVVEERNQTQLRLADSLMARGAMLHAAGAAVEAKPLFREAARTYTQRASSSLAADFGTLLALESSPDPILDLRAHEAEVSAIATAAQGQLVATGDVTGALWISDVGGLAPAIRVKPHDSRIMDVAFDADSRVVYSVADDGSISVSSSDGTTSIASLPDEWGELIGARIVNGPPRLFTLHRQERPDLEKTEEGEAQWQTIFRIVDLARKEAINEISLGSTEKKRTPTSFEVMPDGRAVVIGKVDSAWVLPIDSDAELTQLSSFDEPNLHPLLWWYVVKRIAVSADGRYVALGWSNAIIELWDLHAHKKIFARKLFNRGITSLALVSSGSSVEAILVGGGDGTVSKIDPQERLETRSLAVGIEPATALLTLPDSPGVLQGTADGRLLRWSLEHPAPSRAQLGDLGMHPEIDVSRDGLQLLATPILGPIVLLSGDGFATRTVLSEEDAVGGRFLADPTRAWIANRAGRVSLWDLSNKKEERVLFPGDDEAHKFAASSDRTRYAAWRTKAGIDVFTVDGEPVITLPAPAGECDCSLWLDRSGERLVAATSTAAAVYSVRDGEVLWKTDDFLSTVTLSDDGELVAIFRSDGAIAVFEVDTGKRVSRMRGHAMASAALRFAHGRGILVSGGQEGAISFWQVDTGMELMNVSDIAPISNLAISEQGLIVASAFGDRSIYGNVDAYLWRASSAGMKGAEIGTSAHSRADKE